MKPIWTTRMGLALGILLAIALIAGCASAPAPSASAPATDSKPAAAPASGSKPAATKEMKVATFYTEADAFGVAYREWAKAITDKTNGRITFKTFYGGSLVPGVETLDAVRDGSAEVGNAVSSYFTGKVPDLSGFEPTGGYSLDNAKYVEMVEKLEPIVTSILEQQKVVFLWMQPAPGISTVAKNKHLKTTADWKGLKSRLAGRWQQVQYASLGASPVMTDPGEVYQALQNGTIDTSGAPATMILAFKWYEAAPYVTNHDLPANMNLYIMNKSVWDSLSAEDQKVIKEASKTASRTSLAGLVSAQTEAVKKMESMGAKVYTWNAQEKAEFYKATESIWDAIKKETGPLGHQLIDAVLASRK